MVLSLWLTLRYVSTIPFAEEVINTLTPLQEKELGTFVDLSKQLITLATLALGGIGAFVLKRYEGSTPGKGPMWLAGIAWVLCVFSLSFGVLLNQTLVWMFHSNFFDLTNNRISLIFEAQFWTLAAAIIFVAGIFYFGFRDQPATPRKP